MAPLLEIEHLGVTFTQYGRGTRRRTVTAIRDLSLTAEAGQVTAVVGASGSGKSLLAHAVLGILPYNSRVEGTIRYRGEGLTPQRAAALRGREIALIPQGVTYLDPLMKVGPQLRRGRRGADLARRCTQALARYGLGPETEDCYPFELSGGMARRVLIASAVVEQPRLIIADEPTPGLDAAAAGRILGHLRELADAGAGVLLITHDLDLALAIAHRVTVFYAGQTVEEAAAADFAAPDTLRHPYTRALWHAMPQHGFVPLAGEQPGPGEAGAGCPFAGRCSRRQADCGAASIPLRPFRGGAVRCLHPGEGDEL